MSTPDPIIEVAVPTPLRRCFDYLLPPELSIDSMQVGTRVRIPFGSRKIVGILTKIKLSSSVPPDKLKPIIEVLDQTVLIPKSVMELCRWASNYYHHSLGEVLATAIPVLLRKGRSTNLPKDISWQLSERNNSTDTQALSLNEEQDSALSAIISQLGSFKPHLIDGITGSGKTEIYLQVLQEILDRGQQGLVLVPEISLTPQTLARFQSRFATPIATLHSRLTDKERMHVWLAAKSGEAKIIIGTRSAIFTPMPQLGAIIIDEEHDSSFKQQTKFRYNARDLAMVRGQLENIPVILGSATPSLETLHNVTQNNYQCHKLTRRAGTASLPTYSTVDLRNKSLQHGLSPTLLTAMEKHLTLGNQVLLFINRRGYAPVLLCHGCGWSALCEHCDARLTLHSAPRFLQCHHCSRVKPVPTACPECTNKQLLPIGLGTQRLEGALIECFPQYPLVRIDRDNTQRKGALEELLDTVHSGVTRILLGTQMLVKGHHFPNVTLVGILDADSGLFSSDFRACERLGQLITQVAGRAGRAEKPGQVIVQTHQPDHPLLQRLIKEGYHAFADDLLTERHAAQLPPYSYLALFRADATQKEAAMAALEQIKHIIEDYQGCNVALFGPIPSPMQKRAGRFHAQLLLQANKRSHLQTLLKEVLPNIEKIRLRKRARWILDVDPIDLYY